MLRVRFETDDPQFKTRKRDDVREATTRRLSGLLYALLLQSSLRRTAIMTSTMITTNRSYFDACCHVHHRHHGEPRGCFREVDSSLRFNHMHIYNAPPPPARRTMRFSFREQTTRAVISAETRAYTDTDES